MSGEKTEKPTPKKKKDLRKKAAAARSTDAGMAAGTVALLAVLPTLGSTLYTTLTHTTERALELAGTLDAQQAISLLTEAVVGVAAAVAVPALVVAAAAVAAQALVTRSKPNPYGLKPQFRKLNPKNGVKNLFSLNSLVEGGKGVVKLGVVGVAAYMALSAQVPLIISASDTLPGFLAAVGSAVMTLLAWCAVAAVLVGVADVIWQHKRFTKQSKMTKAEVKQEMKASDGDPVFKAARRSRQLAMSRNRMIAAVADADVVLVNPTHIAVALKYDPSLPAPKVVAKGAGVIADRIRAKAADCDVPVRRHVLLARALYASCKVGTFIPADLYDAVATILAALMAERQRKAGRT